MRHHNTKQPLSRAYILQLLLDLFIPLPPFLVFTVRNFGRHAIAHSEKVVMTYPGSGGCARTTKEMRAPRDVIDQREEMLAKEEGRRTEEESEREDREITDQ